MGAALLAARFQKMEKRQMSAMEASIADEKWRDCAIDRWLAARKPPMMPPIAPAIAIWRRVLLSLVMGWRKLRCTNAG